MSFSPVNIEILANAKEAIAQFQTVNGELGKMDAATLKAGGSISEMDKATRIGTAGLMALTAGVAGFGIMAVKAAMESQDSFNRLGQAMANTGNGSAKARNEVSKLVEEQAKLGFSAQDTADAYGSLITATGSQTESTKLLSLAEDLARYKHESLGEAATVLDRATQGSVKAFKELGITLDAHLPKNQAIAQAFDQLQGKIGGQAVAYTHNFSGEIAVMSAEFKAFSEKVGTTIMPVLITFLQWIKDSISWLGQHKIVLVAVGAVISTYLMLAVKDLTVKLYEQAAAWAAANWQITLIVLAVAAVGAGFDWLWNHVKVFRDVIVDVMKYTVLAIGWVIGAIGDMATTWLKLVTGPIRLFLEVMSHLPIVGGAAKDALKAINGGIADVGSVFKDASSAVDGFATKIGGLANAKLSMPDLLKSPTIPSAIASSDTATGIVGTVPGGNTLKTVKSTASNALASATSAGTTKISASDYKAMQAAANNTRDNFLTSISPTVNQTIYVDGSTAPADIAAASVAAIKYGAVSASLAGTSMRGN